jgi:acyl carrier protein
MTRDEMRLMMSEIQTRHGRDGQVADLDNLRQIGFRSLDFSELALRVEDTLGRELNFQAAALRSIETVGDVLDFLEAA